MKTKQKKSFTLKIHGKKVLVTPQTLLNAARQMLWATQRFQQVLDPDVIQNVLVSRDKRLEDLRDVLEDIGSIEVDNMVEEAADAVENRDTQLENEAESQEEDL